MCELQHTLLLANFEGLFVEKRLRDKRNGRFQQMFPRLCCLCSSAMVADFAAHRRVLKVEVLETVFHY